MPTLTASEHRLDEPVRANNLKELAAMTEGRFFLHRAPLALGNLVKEFLAVFRSLNASSGIQLSFKGSGTPCMVLGDFNRLVEVLDNLLTNALQHTTPGGSIEVALYESDKEIGVSVIDDGTGVDLNDRPHLFKKSWRGKAEKGSGLGLGLYISKIIIEGHGGRIGMHQEVLRKGSMFYFALPKLNAGPIKQAREASTPSSSFVWGRSLFMPFIALLVWFIAIHIALLLGIDHVNAAHSTQWISRTEPGMEVLRDSPWFRWGDRRQP